MTEPDPTSKLVELIRAHPELSTITVIAVTYIDLAQQAPSLVDKLADTLVKLKETNITVRCGGRLGDTTQIARALDWELDEYLGSDLAAVKDASVSPSNEHLTISLLSATTMKYSLCNPDVFIDAVNRGLHYERFDYDVAKHEVLVLGACIQLSISGSYLRSQHDFDAPQVLDALEKIKNVGVVKHPQGQRLLEVRNLVIFYLTRFKIWIRLRFNRPRIMLPMVGKFCFLSNCTRSICFRFLFRLFL